MLLLYQQVFNGGEYNYWKMTQTIWIQIPDARKSTKWLQYKQVWMSYIHLEVKVSIATVRNCSTLFFIFYWHWNAQRRLLAGRASFIRKLEGVQFVGCYTGYLLAFYISTISLISWSKWASLFIIMNKHSKIESLGLLL